jgi:diaminopimelate epimerase
MKLRFWKLTGAGNDFVLTAGAPLGRAGAARARRLCDRRFGAGADGLLALSRNGARVRLDYWNADGSSAFCGNGSRCAALWASAHGWTKGRSFTLDTSRGTLAVRLTGRGRAEVEMPIPSGLKLGLKLFASGRKLIVHYIDTGAPHAVVFVPNIENVDVKALGRELRFHPAFGKAGANVDFVHARNGVLLLRTYERGVEDETLACGTGVVAAAAVSRALGKASDRAKVRVRGGALLNVSFSNDSTTLEGPGETVYTGEVTL